MADVLRLLFHYVEKITIESRAMSEERDQWGRLSVTSFKNVGIGIADLWKAKAWNVVLSVGQFKPLA